MPGTARETRKEGFNYEIIYLPATNRKHRVPKIPPVVVEFLKRLASNALYRDLWTHNKRC